jgi:polar amino acid transport system substrate-binding protein
MGEAYLLPRKDHVSFPWFIGPLPSRPNRFTPDPRELQKAILVSLGLIVFCSDASAQKTVVVRAGDIFPLSYIEGSKPSGIAIDILNAVEQDGKYTFKYKFMLWPAAQKDALSSEDEGIVPLTRTPDRENQYLWIAKLFENRLAFVTTSGTPAPKTMADVLKLSIGTLRGNQAEKPLRAAGARVEVVDKDAQASNATVIHLWKT